MLTIIAIFKLQVGDKIKQNLKFDAKNTKKVTFSLLNIKYL
jgi:hypothetical protein